MHHREVSSIRHKRPLAPVKFDFGKRLVKGTAKLDGTIKRDFDGKKMSFGKNFSPLRGETEFHSISPEAIEKKKTLTDTPTQSRRQKEEQRRRPKAGDRRPKCTAKPVQAAEEKSGCKASHSFQDATA